MTDEQNTKVLADLGNFYRTTEELLQLQTEVLKDQQEWCHRCQELASFHVPPKLYEMIPEVIWRVPLWGSRVFILNAPKVEQSEGGIHLPQDAQRRTNYGWVISVGRDVCDPDAKPHSLTGPPCPYIDPMMLVGQFVNFNPFSVKEVTFSSKDGGFGRTQHVALPVSLCAVADILFPVIGVKPEDWAAEQTSLITRPT